MITIKLSEFRRIYPHLRDAFADGCGVTPHPRLRADDWWYDGEDCAAKGRLPWTEDESGDIDVRPKWRAYDTCTEWQGPARRTLAAAERDAERHNDGCASQGGYGSAVSCAPINGRLHDLDARDLPDPRRPIWPPYGRGCGAARAR